jgi:hypothetical protein
VTFPAAPITPRVRVNLFMTIAVLPGLAAAALMINLGWALALAAIAGLVAFYLVGTLPSGYSVEPGRLVVHRRGLADKRFALAGRPERFVNALAIDWRWYGTGWRPAGREWSAKQGLPPRKVYLAVTDREQAVHVPTEAGTVIVTPAAPGDFVAHGRELVR